ncbi:MAG: 2-oxoacid:acceptor oxidoreductase family protein [Candidatus Glassbacteria bacterium]
MSDRGTEALEKLLSASSSTVGIQERRGEGDGRKVMAMTGNQSVAYAVRQIEYDTVAAFPITPSTELAHDIAKAVADGDIKTDFIAVESEHSAISAMHAAAAAGNTVFTATSSAGLALMHEILHYFAGSRLPGVIAAVNRSIGGPLNILCDHSTIMAQRDTGWMQLFSTDCQEAYYFHIIAPRWSQSCYLPVIVNIDGFELSHITERLEVLPDEVVKDFVGTWDPKYPLATDENIVISYPGIAGADYYAEIKESQMDGVRQASDKFEAVTTEFADIIGKKIESVESYLLDDAQIAIVAMGSSIGTIRDKVDNLRSQGFQAGLLIIKMFRPFPVARVREALRGKKAVGIMERAPVLGAQGAPLYLEVRDALYDLADDERPKIVDLIFGLGGRIPMPDTVGLAYNLLYNLAETPGRGSYRKVYHIDVRDERPDAVIDPSERDKRFYLPLEKKSTSIRMFARGGEGIKTASKILSSTAIESADKYAQGFSVYGAERSGAPTQAYVRIGDAPIHVRAPITHSDIDIFVNPGLLDSETLKGLRKDGLLIVNTTRSPEEIRKELGSDDYKIFTVDGYGIANEELGNPRRNSMAMLAALLGIADGLLDIESLIHHIDHLKFHEKLIEANKKAAARAYFEWKGSD